MEPILLVLGQQEDLARDVQFFLRLLIIGAPGYIGFESLKKYLQCQGKNLLRAHYLTAPNPLQASCKPLLSFFLLSLLSMSD